MFGFKVLKLQHEKESQLKIKQTCRPFKMSMFQKFQSSTIAKFRNFKNKQDITFHSFKSRVHANSNIFNIVDHCNCKNNMFSKWVVCFVWSKYSCNVKSRSIQCLTIHRRQDFGNMWRYFPRVRHSRQNGSKPKEINWFPKGAINHESFDYELNNFVAMWLSAYVAVWLYGYLAM